MNFKAIFFDNDGLLVNTEPLYFESTKEVFAGTGIELTREWFVHEHLGKGRSVSELLREHGMSEDSVEKLKHLRHKRYAEYLAARAVAGDGVEETLQQLRGRFLLAVVTGAHREHFNIVMRKTNLQHFFDFFITWEDVSEHKPHPMPYLKAIELSRKSADQCLVLEDSRNGALAAKAAGLTCYAIPDEMTKTHDFSMADKVLSSIREVPDIVLPR